MVGTYLGVLKTLQWQNPYAFSIKPILDQLGLPPSYYTPRIDGTFEFHLNYPALNFLSIIPFYLAGIRDLRDGILIFHLVSVLIIFGLAPARLKALSIIPFALAGPVLVISWTDSVWAFFLLLSAVAWNRKRVASLVLVGLAGAVKQIALVITPFLLIRLWRESYEADRKQNLVKASGLVLLGFFVPNLPFLLVSPGTWWNATVAPYLPGSPAQVPGGMGLSNILLDLGIPVPSLFYTVTTIAAFLVLLYAYTVRYERFKKYMWAFPMILFLFYQRSFPNYIVYWVFPLIFELARQRRIEHTRLVPIKLNIPVIPSVFVRFRGILHHKFTAPMMIILIFATAFAGFSGLYVSSHAATAVEVRVNSAFDPDKIGAATLLNVTLKNSGSKPILPVFFVKSSFLPDIWLSNATELPPGDAQHSYLIHATDALSAVPKGTSFRVLVSDKLTRDIVGESAVFASNIPAPVVVNPDLKWWTIDGVTGKKIPFGWKLTMMNLDSSTSGITPLGDNATSGLLAKLNYTSIDNAVARLALSQKLPFNFTNINLSVSETFGSNPNPSGVFGIVISDGSHGVYYSFSDTATIQIVKTFANNVTITLPIHGTDWNSIVLTPFSYWTKQAWILPQQATITFFVEAQATGVYYARIGAVTPVGAISPNASS
jgi:hypothetical protein